MKSRTEKRIRDDAARFGMTIKRAPRDGGVRLTDSFGNERIYANMTDISIAARIYEDKPITTPIYEVGEIELKGRLRVAAKNSAEAKRIYREKVRTRTADAVLTAKKVIR